jgi:hypothetical protein
MPIANPLRFPQAWDTFQVGAVTNPGIVPPGGITGFERSYEFDVKKGKGAYGGTVTFTQKPPSKGKITIHLWTMSQIDALETFIPLLQYDPTKKAVSALDIYHPSLSITGVRSVVTEDISPLIHEGKGLYSVTFSFIEYNPPPKASAVSTPTISRASASRGTTLSAIAAGAPAGTTRDPVSDANERQIALLTQQAGGPGPGTPIGKGKSG